MGISLNGLTPAGTYPGLIKTGDNTAISGTPKVLSDGNGNDLPMEVSTAGVNLTGSPTVNSVAIANTTQVAAKQDTLVSGTNIKTINSTSILGSGNISVVTSPSGVSGAIQFSNGSAFASDAANFFWDDTNKRLGIGTNAPTSSLHNTGVSRFLSVIIGQAAPTAISSTAQDVAINLSNGSVGIGGFTTFTPSARVHIKGSGSTSATTSLLVQNSGATTTFSVNDAGELSLPSTAPKITLGGNLTIANTVSPTRQMVYDVSNGNLSIFSGGVGQGYFIGNRLTTSTASTTFVTPNALNAEGSASITAYDSNGNIALNAANNGNRSIALKGLGSSGAVLIGNITTGNGTSYSAILRADSTTQGFLPPRMTTTQKNAIASPAAGLIVYDSTLGKLCVRTASEWETITSL
jgi:hypothetical protein